MNRYYTYFYFYSPLNYYLQAKIENSMKNKMQIGI